jgi:hypothetical protein
MVQEVRAVIVVGPDIASLGKRSGKQESRGEREYSMVLHLISFDLPLTGFCLLGNEPAYIESNSSENVARGSISF